MLPEHVETERLLLERCNRENVALDELHEICARDPDIEEVTRHLPWDPHETLQDTADLLDRLDGAWDDGERLSYAVRPREGVDAEEIAGIGGLMLDWERRTGTLFLWLRKRFWGRGYSGERAAAMLDLAFDRLDLELVVAEVEPGNDNSRRAVERYVERFGGQHDGRFRNFVAGDGGIDLHRYTVTRDQYRAATDD